MYKKNVYAERFFVLLQNISLLYKRQKNIYIKHEIICSVLCKERPAAQPFPRPVELEDSHM